MHLGELSSARQALEGSEVAPGTRATLDKLTDRQTTQTPPAAGSTSARDHGAPTDHSFRSGREAVREEPPFFTKRSGRWTVGHDEHLRSLLDEVRSMHLLFRLGENLSRAHVPSIAVQMVRCGRMTVLTKPDGGVREIVSGDVLRRLVTRTTPVRAVHPSRV